MSVFNHPAVLPPPMIALSLLNLLWSDSDLLTLLPEGHQFLIPKSNGFFFPGSPQNDHFTLSWLQGCHTPCFPSRKHVRNFSSSATTGFLSCSGLLLILSLILCILTFYWQPVSKINKSALFIWLLLVIRQFLGFPLLVLKFLFWETWKLFQDMATVYQPLPSKGPLS